MVGPMSHPETHTPTAGAVKRALAILEYLDSSSRKLNISEMSRKLAIPKSSAHVIVHTLERLGYVERDASGRRFSLGFRARALGHGLSKAMLLAEAAQPPMRDLSQNLGLAAHLAVADDHQGVFIQKIEPPGQVHFDTYIGRRMDLHCTAAGKVILAFGPPQLREEMLSKSGYMKHTRNTITSPRVLQRELRQVQQLGYADDEEEEELGVRCVAVPVFDPAGRFLAALSVTGATEQITPLSLDRVTTLLQRTAASIAAEPLPAVQRVS